MTALPALALEELARRRHNAARGVAACQMTVDQANLRVAFYCALAAFAGAALPADIAAQMRPQGDDAPVEWWDFAPPGTDRPAFLKAARKELQRATVVAIIRHERDQTRQTLTEARRLIALYRALAQTALGPLPLTLRADRAEHASSSGAVGERTTPGSGAGPEARQAAWPPPKASPTAAPSSSPRSTSTPSWPKPTGP